ncbi:hypothetical protein O0L34_g3184 [Tuta absoluta]|nr:hypothetical protein O0L34_g3184 [Tuta absoluta]
MSDSNDDADRSPTRTPPRKVPKKGGWTRKKEGNTTSQHRTQNFRLQWLNDPAFKDWLLEDKSDSTKAKCAFCPDTTMVAEISNIKIHASTKKHLANKPGSTSKTQKLTSFGFQKGVTPQNKEKARAEIKLAGFFAEHNIPFSVADHLTDLLKEIVIDSKLIKEIDLKRTKVTAVVKNVIGEGHKSELANKLKQTKFSIMTDETTDVTSIKTACVVVRYFDEDAQKICSAFWELYKVFKENIDAGDIATANAESLFKALIESFTCREVPLTNAIGFGSDGCNVMMGDNNSVKTRLLNELPGITITKCVCHSAHLCASEACKMLPENLEQLARDIYNFFKHSDKRQFDFRNFQSFVDVEPHKILKPSQTRWLSLLAVVERILEQWEALHLFFIDFTTNRTHKAKAEVRNRAIFILEKLSNPFYKLYFGFLEWSLPIFIKFNLEFQSEKVVVHNLHEKIRELYQEILLRYLRRDYVMRPNLSEIDPASQQHQLHDAALYFGVKVYELMKHQDVVRRPAEIAQFYSHCKNFCQAAATEIRKRYNMDDPILSKLQVFGPKSALSHDFRNHFPTLMPLKEVVPRIIAPDDYAKKQIIDDQWRKLPNAIARYPEGLTEISEPDKFWAQLLKTDDFSELARFALSTLSLPHANADCERVFSKVNLIKTNLRNRLTVETVNGTLLAAESTKGPSRAGNCVKFEPSREMYDRMTKAKLYAQPKKTNVAMAGRSSASTSASMEAEDVSDVLFEVEVVTS